MVRVERVLGRGGGVCGSKKDWAAASRTTRRSKAWQNRDEGEEPAAWRIHEHDDPCL
jgi:hypothetical protein